MHGQQKYAKDLIKVHMEVGTGIFCENFVKTVMKNSPKFDGNLSKI